MILLAGSFGAMLPAWLSSFSSSSSSSRPSLSIHVRPPQSEARPGPVSSPLSDYDDESNVSTSLTHAEGPARIRRVPEVVTSVEEAFAASFAAKRQQGEDDSTLHEVDSNAGVEALLGEGATSDGRVCLRILVVGGVSSLFLLLSVASWEVVASMCFLAGFFASWQFINVVILARLALQLKAAQLLLQREEEGKEEDQPEPPYSVAFVAVIAMNVVAQVVIDSIIFSYLQMRLRSACWVVMWLFFVCWGGFVLLCVCIFRPFRYLLSRL